MFLHAFAVTGPCLCPPFTLSCPIPYYARRDELGNFSETGVEDAGSDLEQALDLTRDTVKTDHVALQCRVMSLLKLVHVLSQTKVQMGQQPSDVELEKVKRLNPCRVPYLISLYAPCR